MAQEEPVDNQFILEELKTIREALIFTLNCVVDKDIPPFNKMDAVLAKVDGLINRV